MIFALAACLLVLVALGVTERAARDRAWRAIPVRVHVNGSRGKSTVTRLVWSALREAGVPAVAKTTGTLPRLLLPDGSETPLVRRGPASIREQLRLLRLAHRLRVRAVVLECMALDPELQWVSEREMVQASIGVITNVRRDHEEVMGRTLESIAATLANSIPRGSVLVCGERQFAPLFEERAARVGTRVVFAPATAQAGPRWLAEDQATALAVTRELGIDDETALRGFASAPMDPGVAAAGAAAGPGWQWLDATAANDPDSLALLLPPLVPDVVVYNHRDDRPQRLLTFSRHARALASAETLIVTGARPPWTAWRGLRQARPGGETSFVAVRRLGARLRQLPPSARVVFCGNTRGFDLPALLREVSSDG